MTLYFHSPNAFPLDVLFIQGLSAKVTDSPIGRFGTGLKYAIAVILRQGGSIQLLSEGKTYDFFLDSIFVRDREFKQVFMKDETGERRSLPITSEYGKDWQPWQAYRELFSNCLDEKGDVSNIPVVARTIFVVEGLDEIYDSHDTIFLPKNQTPIYRNSQVEYYDKPSNNLYFKGIRVASLEKPMNTTPNFLASISLTEDRTLASEGIARIYLRSFISAPQPVPSPVLTDEGLMEYCRPELSSDTISIEFVNSCKGIGNLPDEILAVLARYKKLNTSVEVKETSYLEKSMLIEAVKIAKQLVPELNESDIFVSATPLKCKGFYDSNRNQIIISPDGFEEGMNDLTATIIEEALHKYRGFRDETRQFQDFLLRRLTNELIRRRKYDSLTSLSSL